MKLTEDIRPVTYMKERAADLLEQVNQTRRPVIITQNGSARAVVMDTASYEHMEETLAMLSLVSQSEADAKKRGRTYTTKEVFANARKILAKRLARK
jgi:prevent-host-death family protein